MSLDCSRYRRTTEEFFVLILITDLQHKIFSILTEQRRHSVLSRTIWINMHLPTAEEKQRFSLWSSSLKHEMAPCEMVHSVVFLQTLLPLTIPDPSTYYPRHINNTENMLQNSVAALLKFEF
uniref:Uncharacterized protein n=1 Tax=Octopus bimaculoides TaxID=37653 RepID=A0A0L8HH52_OCTBM